MNGLEISIKFMGALLYTTIAGSIALAFWYLAGRLFEKYGYFRWYYIGLRVVTCLFLIPVSYLAVSGINRATPRWHGLLFTKTPTILVVCRILYVVWILGMLVIASNYVFSALSLHRRNKKNFLCNKEKQQLFESVCAELKIPAGRVKLRQNYHVITAEFMGILHPQVILPVKEFSKAELRTIFVHELVHYKQRDIYLKCLAMLVLVFHYFNPMAWKLSKTVCRWSEYACDERACAMVGGTIVYFNNLLRMAESTWQKKCHFVVGLMEHKNELEERIEHLRKIDKVKKKSVGFAILLSCVLLIFSSATVMAASDGLARQYLNVVERTDIVVEEKLTEKPLYTKYVDNGPDGGVTIEAGEVDKRTEVTSLLGWTVPASTMKQTGTFYVSKGQAIIVHIYLISHIDKELMVGIIKPSGERAYVKGNDTIIYDFTADSSGNYRVFVQNNNSVEMEADGSCMVR